MRPTRSLLARLLAVLLLMQWAGAALPHARAMAAMGSAMAVELCSPSGMRTILVDQNGQPVEKAQDPSCCDLCQGPAAIEADAPGAPAIRIAHAAPAHPAGRAGLPPFPPRAPPQQPRAPPAA
ncbi:DUF2946 family protein [Roseomonas sp. SSH11]|uniref:DUF2946 family protein n=1 Tax=Pararoseomonas baculiformis TaxID=2820812 RepID=A0ABS4A8C4_9PROT|nr:DUF2946 family protein [Pararoseomonas baculiformis]MBP0443250.1 DUF2946 family protein [Pararoseomonas baculiformis]